MLKNDYLQYFRKNQLKTIKAEQSADENFNSKDQITPSPVQISSFCSPNTQQADPVDNSFSDLTNHQNKNHSPKSLYVHNQNQKSHNFKNIRINNHSSQMFKRRKETEGNQQSPSKIPFNLRKNCSQLNPNIPISQELKAVKFLTPTQHQSNPRNLSQFGYQRLKTTLQAPNPIILQNQKLFTQPIKPYDRHKTARNKKFKTLKTAFGDLNSSCRNYNDQYTMSLQNLRMGWRIVNTKSMIQEYLNSTYFTYHLYNGSVINKEKNKEAAQREKKKINLKQMKNVYKVFFNQNIMFSKKENKNPKIFESIKQKDEVHDYVLSQSQMKLKSHSGSFMTPNESLRSHTLEHVSPKAHHRIQRPRGSHKNKPCFFRKTYNQSNQSLNTKICQEQKYQKLSRSLYCKSSSQGQKSLIETEPSQISMEEDHFQMNQIFGKGNTIIELRDLQIQPNSSIKKDDLLVLELMAQNGNINLKKGIMSSAIKYSEIKRGVKFAIDSKVGDFVPLKIWKYHGINLIEMGIIDLNLIVFRNRKKYFDIQNKIQSETWSDGIQDIQLFRQERQSVTKKNRMQEREILYYHTRQKLRKNKKMQIEVTVSLNCLIYSRKFSRLRTNVTQNSQKENMFAEDSQEENDDE